MNENVTKVKFSVPTRTLLENLASTYSNSKMEPTLDQSHAYLRTKLKGEKQLDQNSVVACSEETSNHPLLNSLILDTIFRYLSRKDILNSRLVCSTWEREASRLLRRCLTLYFHDICHIRNFKKLMDTNLIKKPNRDLPFARVYLRSTFRLGHDVAQEFFQIHGYHLRHIEVAKVGCDCGANFFQKLIFIQAKYLTSLSIQIISGPIGLSPNSAFINSKYSNIKAKPKVLKWKLPHLKHLHLRHQLFVERPRFIDDLLEACVNLEVLTTDESSPLFCQNIFIPRILATRNRWNKLKKIMVGDTLHLSNEQLLQFAERKFRLEHLTLSLNSTSPQNYTETNVINLTILLTSLSDSLKKVVLFNSQADRYVEMLTFPPMSKLVQLRLSNIVFQSKNLEGLPSLREYYIVHEFPKNLLYCYDHVFSIPSHRSLHCMTFYPIWPVSNLNISSITKLNTYTKEKANSLISEISRAFPCLRILCMSGNDFVLKNIYKKMPFLEQLTIYGPVSDEGITGVSLELCNRMHSEQDFELIEADQLDQLNFIGNLKKLKKLLIPSLPFNKCLLTEVSVFLGFICCDDLIELDIDNKELHALWKDEVSRLHGTGNTS